MVDMDRWRKRLWSVNGVVLLLLVVLGIGAILVAWLSGLSTGGNAVIPPDTGAAASAQPPAVRFSAPRRILGTSTRLVVVRYGKGRQRGYDEGGGPVVNLLFLDGAQPGRVLLDRPAYVRNFNYPEGSADSLQHWIEYYIAFEDTDRDGQLDSDDERDLYVSDVDGTNLRRVLPAGLRVLEATPVGDGRRLFVSALEVPQDWRGSDDELPQRAFLYEVRGSVLTPYATLDSLAQRAARILARP
jgi:hypothetical protein